LAAAIIDVAGFTKLGLYRKDAQRRHKVSQSKVANGCTCCTMHHTSQAWKDIQYFSWRNFVPSLCAFA
jgi:hypothetical protein